MTEEIKGKPKLLILFLVFMVENLIVLVEGKYPLSPQVKNKWGTILSDELFFNAMNAKPQNVWRPVFGLTGD